MSKYLNIEINVSPHVKKYISYHLNRSKKTFDPLDEIKLDKSHHIGLFILSLLQKKYKISKDQESIKYNNKKINTKVNVLLKEQYEKGIDPRYNFLGFSNDGVRKLDKFIDSLFRQELYTYLNSYQLVKGKNRIIKKGLLLFYKKYQLDEEDIAIETLLRDYRRYRNKNKFLIIK